MIAKFLAHKYALFILIVCCFSQRLYSQRSVEVASKQNTIEIKNGLTGIVVPIVKNNNKQYPSPIQSFIYVDGTYSDQTPNYLYTPSQPISMRTSFIKQTSSEVSVRIEYKFEKKEFVYGTKKYKGGEPGIGYYTCTITVIKGEKSILIEEDTNYDIGYSVEISNGLLPDKARYRGWSSNSIEAGYETPGKVYRPENQRRYPMDATVDLNYQKAVNYPMLVLWEPAGGEENSGRYWQVFNSTAGENANLLGFFQGQPSRLIGAKHVGPFLRINPAQQNVKANAEIAVIINRRGPDETWYSRKRFQWAVFISSKKDLLSPEQQQPIATELNNISGLANQIDEYFSKPVKIVPAFYKGAVYLSEQKVADIRKQVKSSMSFYEQLCAIDGQYKPIWDAWRYPDSAISLKRYLIRTLETLVQQFKNGEGTYYADYRYWKGGSNYKYNALCISALFADDQITLTITERKKLEQLVALMARVVWDDNNVPLFDESGVNFGPGNMMFQYRNNGRQFFALLLAKDQEFSTRAKNAAIAINNDIDAAIYTNGMAFGSPHYIQATIDPVLLSALQLKQAGVTDLFKLNEKITKFAKFYSCLLTPPSCRFSNNRKLISFGDGSEENAATFGLLASGLQEVDPKLSRELKSAFWYGPLRSSAFAPTGLAIDIYAVPEKRVQITTSCYSGYISHFRSGMNTNNETATWVLNGDTLSDHRNDDAGETAIYALKAPLSLSRSSFYYPSATDARIRTVVVPESMFTEWYKSEQPIAERSLTNRTWTTSQVINFANVGYSSATDIKMQTKDGKTWTRRVMQIAFREQDPIIIFYDSVSNRIPAIWSMNMMSEGSVNTPAGAVIPEKRIYNNVDLKQLPSATGIKTIKPGIGKFLFTGQNWPLHPSKGINWNLYTASPAKIDFTLASWATTWQNDIERVEFLKSNAKNYIEEQQIIRLKSDNPFLSILVPFFKSNIPYWSDAVFQQDGTALLKHDEQDFIEIGKAHYIASYAEKTFAAVLAPQAGLNKNGLILSGGCIEIEFDKQSVQLRLHGLPGARKVVLPFEIKVPSKVAGAGVNFKVGNNKSILEINYVNNSNNLANGEKGYKEYLLYRK